MSSAFAPRGTQFQHSPDGVTYTTIAEAKKISRSGAKADLADVTNMDSASSEREFLATLIDEGEISLDLNFVPGNAAQLTLRADFTNQTKGWYKIVLPNALGTWGPIQGFVVSDDFELPIDKEGTRQVKIKFTGAPTATI